MTEYIVVAQERAGLELDEFLCLLYPECNKGYVRRKTTAKAHIYRPAKAKSQVQNTALKNILARFFDGSAEALVLRMLENEEITPGQLKELRHSQK